MNPAHPGNVCMGCGAVIYKDPPFTCHFCDKKEPRRLAADTTLPMPPTAPTPPRHYYPLKGGNRKVQALIRAIEREPGITVEELYAITGWRRPARRAGQLERYLIVLEMAGFCARQKQLDKRTGRYVVCVRCLREGDK